MSGIGTPRRATPRNVSQEHPSTFTVDHNFVESTTSERFLYWNCRNHYFFESQVLEVEFLFVGCDLGLAGQTKCITEC
jgi:hypothetical protein